MSDTLSTKHTEGAVIDRIDDIFERQGFANTSVDDIRAAADISLRTLYRRYGSREQMVVEVLRNRAAKYLAHLGKSRDLRDLFERSGSWMDGTTPLGCLFLRARADHPGFPAIEQEIVSYHRGLRSCLAAFAAAEGLDGAVDELFVLHEGLISTAPSLGARQALDATRAALNRLLDARSSVGDH